MNSEPGREPKPDIRRLAVDSAKSFGRPRELRLHRFAEFSAVRNRGRSTRGKLLRMTALFVEGDFPSKVGLITTRKLGNAVKRNRVRRLLREIHRQNQALLLPGFWVVVLAHREAAAAGFQELHREWLHLAGRLSILRVS